MGAKILARANKMRPIWRWLVVAGLGISCGLILVECVAIAFLLTWPAQPQHFLGEHLYRIVVEGKETSLRADRIERQDGCVIFYRHGRVDTILCENMGTLLVTEAVE